MTEDTERWWRDRKEFENERDRRMEERFQAQDQAVKLQIAEMKRRLQKIEDAQNRMAGLVLGAPIVTAIIVYLLTRSSTGG